MKKNKNFSLKKDLILSNIVNKIITIADPDKIILFGSRALNQNDKNSDYDICVLKKNIKNNLRLSQKLYLNMKVGASVDLIVTTPRRFTQLKDKWFFIYRDIDRYGIIIYEK